MPTHAEPTIQDVLDVLRHSFKDVDDQFRRIGERFNGVDYKFKGIDEQFKRIDERFNGIDLKFKSVDEQFKRIDERFNGVDRKLKNIDEQFKRIDQRFDTLESVMVTKDYLNEKLTDLRGDLVVLVRKEDRKLGALVDALVERHVLDQKTGQRILELEPFAHA